MWLIPTPVGVGASGLQPVSLPANSPTTLPVRTPLTPALLSQFWVRKGGGDERARTADLLNANGWIVAFPQRRGRGGSDGLYDEDFAEDRLHGYSPKAARSLLGAERALKDADAALVALRRRPDVDAGKVLLGGVSRGGVVAIMQAGQNPSRFSGVINFVGGWVGERRGETEINPTLFRRIGSFDGLVLSIYGEEDEYYSLVHSKSNLAEMQALGANSQLHVVKLPGYGKGHWAIAVPTLWEGVVSEYLNTID